MIRDALVTAAGRLRFHHKALQVLADALLSHAASTMIPPPPSIHFVHPFFHLFIRPRIHPCIHSCMKAAEEPVSQTRGVPVFIGSSSDSAVPPRKALSKALEGGAEVVRGAERFLLGTLGAVVTEALVRLHCAAHRVTGPERRKETEGQWFGGWRRWQ